jgi:WD40 repeat protein
MAWDPFHAFNLYSTLEDGQVQCIDVRVADTPLFTFRAHEKTASSISFSSSVPGMFATASIDKTVKVWDSLGVQDYSASVLSNKGTTATAKGKAKSGSGFEPRCVAYKTMNVGKLFALQFYSDDPFMLATAGDKGMVAIWETDESEVIRNHFESRTVQGSSVYSSLTTADASSNNDGATAKPFAIATLAEQVVPQNAEMEDDSWMDEPTDADGRGAKKEQKKKSKGKK